MNLESPARDMTRPWMRWTLALAAIYNIAWGAFIVLFPLVPFRLLNMPLPNYPQIWQCVGMIVGVYGVGYGIAALDPLRHWPIVLVGLLGKLFGPIGFIQAGLTGTLPWRFGLICLTNDLIWWVPFTLILIAARRHAAHPEPRGTSDPVTARVI